MDTKFPPMPLKNPNFAKYNDSGYSAEIDQLVTIIHTQLSQLENNPSGHPEVIVHFLRAAMMQTMYLPLL